MVHDITGYDNWYHEIVNHHCISSNWTYVAIDCLNDGNITEAIIALNKSVLQNQKVMSMLREDYIERTRLEKGAL